MFSVPWTAGAVCALGIFFMAGMALGKAVDGPVGLRGDRAGSRSDRHFAPGAAKLKLDR
jgi:hypothetical protein